MFPHPKHDCDLCDTLVIGSDIQQNIESVYISDNNDMYNLHRIIKI